MPERIIEKACTLVRTVNESLKQILQSERTIKDDSPDRLVVLRQFNSYSPTLHSSNRDARGGGYLLVLGGKAYVIDPGIDFLKNFFEQGYTLADIDAVIITHAHNDHTTDLESITSLLYKHNSGDTGQSYRKIDLYVSEDTEAKIASWILHSTDVFNNRYILKPSMASLQLPNGADLHTLPCEHKDPITGGHGVGLVFTHEGKNIIFTGDTGWSNSVCKAYELWKGNCHLLVAHIGTLRSEEIEFLQKKEESPKVYSKHLALLGLANCIHSLEPDFIVVSEFGEELKAIRSVITDGLQIGFGKPCIPGDIGLEIRLSDNSVRGSQTDDWIPVDKVICSPNEESRMSYKSPASC